MPTVPNSTTSNLDQFCSREVQGCCELSFKLVNSLNVSLSAKQLKGVVPKHNSLALHNITCTHYTHPSLRMKKRRFHY